MGACIILHTLQSNHDQLLVARSFVNSCRVHQWVTLNSVGTYCEPVGVQITKQLINYAAIVRNLGPIPNRFQVLNKR